MAGVPLLIGELLTVANDQTIHPAVMVMYHQASTWPTSSDNHVIKASAFDDTDTFSRQGADVRLV